MRRIEVLIASLLFAAALCSCGHSAQFWLAARCLVFVAAALLVPHAWLEGIHWQMLPIYAGVVTLAVLGVRNTQPGAFFGLATIGLLIVGIVCSWALPMFQLPRPTGAHPVGTRTMFLVDPSRLETHDGAPPGNRELAVQLWYPSRVSKGRHAVYRRWRETELRSTHQSVLATHSIQDAPVSEGAFPVLIFNHAWRGFRNRSTFLAQELASHGFVVAAVSHPYNCAVVELPGKRVVRFDGQVDIGDFDADPYVPLENRLEIAETEMRIQTDDDRFVLDQMSRMNLTRGHPLEGRLDLERVGAYGHSFGGTVAVQLAREDERVKAALELDGVLHGAAAEHGLTKPLMLIEAAATVRLLTTTNSLDRRAQERAQLWNLIASAKQATLKRFGGYRVVVRGINHENFSDKGFMSPLRKLTGIGSLPQWRAAQIISTYAVAFFRWSLINEPQGILSKEVEPFPEARMEDWYAA
jgi:dienelactone hydrolase